ncbi:MAG: NUDIX domain-containing protein [Acidobacteriota bacterium]
MVTVREGSPFVAMIATKGKTRWGLPKGAVSEGESSQDAALREVREETGLEARVLQSLETIEYFFRTPEGLIHKTVDFYLMKYERGQIEPQLSEVDDAAWIELEDAIRRSSFDSEKKLLLQVRESWQALTPEQRVRIYG